MATSQARVWKYGGFCKADHRHKASDLLFVHCVSSEPTLLVPMGYRVFSFECREIHISFLDSLHIRRIAILIVYLSLKVDEIFADCNSPALVEIHSSCAFIDQAEKGGIVPRRGNL